MDYSTVFHFQKAPYQTVRYDTSINVNWDLLEAALLGFPGSDPPGSASNYPDVTPTTGMRWIDTGNDQEKVYYGGSWNVVNSF